SRAHQKVVLFYNWPFRRSRCARRDSSLEFQGVRAGAAGSPCAAVELDHARQRRLSVLHGRRSELHRRVPGTTPPRYSEILVETNPVLREHFDWLYARVMNKLSVHLQAEVRTADELALAGFHVWQGQSIPTSSLSIHFDLQYMSIPWPDLARSDHSRPLSFTLPIALPRGGGGLNTWDLSYEEQAAHFQATRTFAPVAEMAKS